MAVAGRRSWWAGESTVPPAWAGPQDRSPRRWGSLSSLLFCVESLLSKPHLSMGLGQAGPRSDPHKERRNMGILHPTLWPPSVPVTDTPNPHRHTTLTDTDTPHSAFVHCTSHTHTHRHTRSCTQTYSYAYMSHNTHTLTDTCGQILADRHRLTDTQVIMYTHPHVVTDIHKPPGCTHTRAHLCSLTHTHTH